MSAGQCEHYKQRLRDLLPFGRHSELCAYTQWQVAEMLQKAYGENYSAGDAPPCNCGFAALSAIIWAEVGTNLEPV